MPIYLPCELQTEVHGEDGLICIKQTHNNEEREIWLTVHQFETIFNNEKRLVNEALGIE